jgi:hypothetical protein
MRKELTIAVIGHTINLSLLSLISDEWEEAAQI